MKKIKFIFYFVLIFICLFYLVQSSYAKYKKDIEGDLKSSIAKWNIKVNDELITNKSKLTNNITPIFEGNEYVKDNVIAPGVEGYYDIIIKSNVSNYPFTYQINSNVSTSSDVKDLITTRYIINPDTDNIEKTYSKETGITGTFTQNDTVKIRIFIKWNDIIDTTMDNQKDTEVAIDSNSKALMEVKLKFTQQNNN